MYDFFVKELSMVHHDGEQNILASSSMKSSAIWFFFPSFLLDLEETNVDGVHPVKDNSNELTGYHIFFKHKNDKSFIESHHNSD